MMKTRYDRVTGCRYDLKLRVSERLQERCSAEMSFCACRGSAEQPVGKLVLATRLKKAVLVTIFWK